MQTLRRSRVEGGSRIGHQEHRREPVPDGDLVVTSPERSARDDPSRGVWVAAGAIVTAFAAVSIWFVMRRYAPSVFGDELTYMEAAASLADGDGLRVRDGGYPYAPLFPMLASLAFRVTPDRVAAYHAVLVLNVVLLVSSLVPLALMARRILPTRAAVGAALVTLVLPVSIYAGYFMTDVLGVVCALWALLAIQWAAERPTVGRQLGALAGCAIAVAVRPQFVVLGATFVAALLATYLLVVPREPLRGFAWRLWPTGLTFIVGLAVVLARGLVGEGASLLGAYSVLWRGYDPVDTLRWSAYHVLDLVLYLLVVPALCLPFALVALARRARSSRPHAAFLSTLLASLIFALLLVGAFSTTAYSEDRIHDRYLVYVAPVLVIALAWWWHEGLPRSRGGVVGVVALAVLALAVPFGSVVLIDSGLLFDAAGTALWAAVGDISTLRTAQLAFIAVLVAGTAIVLTGSVHTRKFALAIAAVLSVLVTVSLKEGSVAASDRGAFAPSTARRWVDRAAGNRRVTTLVADSRRCAAENLVRTIVETEFFNESIDGMLLVGPPLRANLPARRAEVTSGRVGDLSGKPIVADLVLAPAGVVLDGRLVATGTSVGLNLWEVRGPVRLVGLPTSAALTRAVCEALARGESTKAAAG